MRSGYFCLMFCMVAMLSACGAPQQQVSYPEMDSPSFTTYAAQCSLCHAPPRPSAHTAGEWPAVIARMQGHRIESRIPPIQASDMLVIRDYLRRHAKVEK